MNTEAPPLAGCPHCASPVPPGSIVCRHCGSVLPLEALLQKAADSMRVRTDFARETRVTLFLWLLALIPFALVPPLTALAMVLLDVPRFAAGHGFRRAALVAATLLNIGLSIAFWIAWRHQLAGDAAAALRWIGEHLGPAQQVPQDAQLQPA